MRMVLAYYGVKLEDEIRDAFRSSTGGTTLIMMMEYPKALGFKVEEKCGDIDDIARYIANGRRVIVRQWLNAKRKLDREDTHLRVVIGYDYDTQMIYMRDPNKKGPSRLTFQEFNNLWDVQPKHGSWGATKNWMLVIYK